MLFAGIIVCIALLGMFALGVSFLYGLAVAAAIGVAFTMIAALTLLPALLGFIGPRVLSRTPEEGPGRPTGPGWSAPAPRASGPSGRTSSAGVRCFPAVVALARRGVIALPFFSLRLGSSDQGNDPVGTTTREAYDMLAQGFGPGFNGPLLLVTEHAGPGRH